MLAKLVAWGKDRQAAASSLVEALDRLLFAGVKTNREYLKRILVSEPFINGDTCTDFVVKYAALLAKPELSKQDMARMLAGYLFAGNVVDDTTEQDNSPWVKEELRGFRNV
jgi:3-methylcrotonyl-CoA carboxylase alpha subunit